MTVKQVDELFTALGARQTQSEDNQKQTNTRHDQLTIIMENLTQKNVQSR